MGASQWTSGGLRVGRLTVRSGRRRAAVKRCVYGSNPTDPTDPTTFFLEGRRNREGIASPAIRGDFSHGGKGKNLSGRSGQSVSPIKTCLFGGRPSWASRPGSGHLYGDWIATWIGHPSDESRSEPKTSDSRILAFMVPAPHDRGRQRSWPTPAPRHSRWGSAPRGCTTRKK